MTFSELIWVAVVAIGPILIALLFIYAYMRRRRLSAGEKSEQRRKVKEIYNSRQ